MKRTILIFISILALNIVCFGQGQKDSLSARILELEFSIKEISKRQSVLSDSLENFKIELYNKESSDNEKLEYFSKNWIPILTFLIALITIFFGWRAVVHNRKIKLYELVLDITKEYASEEMLNSILLIRKWEQDNNKLKKDFAVEFGKIRKSNYSQVKDIDIARRKISHFFNRIFLLKKNGVIEKKEIMKIITAGQIEILNDLIEPLEKSINPDYNKTVFKFYSDLKKDLEKR